MGDAATVYEAAVVIKAQLDGLKQQIRSLGGYLTNHLGNMGRSAGTAFSHALRTAISAGLTLGLSGLAGGGAFAAFGVKLASDAEEAASKFQQVFGSAGKAVTENLDEFASKAGRSAYGLRAMAADVGALIGPMGFTRKETGELSAKIVRLAQDLSSFHNLSTEDALTALRAGLVGESEPLRRLGVQLSEAKIQGEAFRMGIAKTKDEVQGKTKALAIMSVVLRETAVAQGDAIRTATSFSNSFRALRESAGDLAIDFGRLFLPAATAVVRFLREQIEIVRQNAKQWEEWGRSLGVITQNILLHLSDGLATVREMIDKASNSLAKLFSGDSAMTMKKLVSEMLEAFEVLTADPGQTFDFIRDSLELAFTQGKILALQAFDEIKATAAGVFGGIARVAVDAFDRIREGIRGLGLDISATFAGVSKVAFAALTGTLTPGGASGLFDSGRSQAQEAMKSRIDFARQSLGGIGSSFSAGFDASHGAAKATSGGATGALQQHAASLQLSLAKTLEGMKAASAELKKSREDAAKAATPAASLSSLLPSLADAIGKGLAGAGAATGDMLSRGARAAGGGLAGLADKPRKEQRLEFVGLTELNKRIQSGLGNGEEKRDSKRIADGVVATKDAIEKGLTSTMRDAVKYLSKIADGRGGFSLVGP